jgi:hypothetical protein
MSTRTKANLWILLASLAVSACGGSQPPAESPEQAPGEGEPAPTEPSKEPGATGPAEGEHTMPDGTKMPGHHHEEGAPASEPSQ